MQNSAPDLEIVEEWGTHFVVAERRGRFVPKEEETASPFLYEKDPRVARQSPLLHEKRPWPAAIPEIYCREQAWCGLPVVLVLQESQIRTFPAMKKLALLATLLAAACLPQALHAQKVTSLELFDSKIYGINPGMDALLVLTPEQQTKLEEARDAWKNDEELKSAKAAFEPLKSDKSPEADAAKGAFYTAQKTARAKYDAVVESVLTSDQKSLIESLNEFARQQWELVKGEETHKARSEKFRQDSLTALPGVLTPAQIQLLGANPPPE